jgi:hypothetical protein
MISFKKYLHLNELGDALNQPLDDIDLTPKSNGSYSFNFNVNNLPYQVYFRKKSIFLSNMEITNKGYDISFVGPQGTMDLTGLGSASEVYRKLILSIRKLIEKENPEAFAFYGAYPQQDWMYDKFYQRYLKSGFTKIASMYYLRNDILEKIKNANNEKWRVIQQSMAGLDSMYSTQQIRFNDIKKKDRENYLKFRKLVGKIISYNDRVYYLKDFKFNNLKLLYVWGGRLVEKDLKLGDDIMPYEILSSKDASFDELEVNRVKTLLNQEMGISAEVWVG